MMLDFNNLTIDQVKKLNQINIGLQEDFNHLIDQFLNKTNKNIAYLLSIVTSRNTYQGELYHNILKLVLAVELIKSDEIDEIIFPSKVLRDVFVAHHPKANISVQYTNNKKNSLFKSIAIIFLQTLQLVLSKDSKRKKLVHKNNLVLIDTFILANSIKAGKYIDRYYNGLWENLSEEQRKNVWFLPEILGRYNRKSVTKIAAHSKENILFKQDFLKWSDYLNAFIKLLKMRFPEGEKFFIRGMDVTKLIEREFKSTKLNSSAFKGVLNYLFVKRLKQEKIKLNLLIDWNENQPIDKGLVKGLHDFFPGTYTKGYQGFIISTEFNFYIQPTDYEIDNGVIPDEICVVGKGLENNIKRFSKNIKVTTAPAFRFANVYKNFERQDHSKRIMVALPIGLKESMEIMALVYGALKNLIVDFEIWVKPHPVLNTEKLKGILGNKWRKDYNVVIGDFSERVSQVDLLIGSTSSTLVETLARGIPVVVIGSQNGITQNPVPKTINQRIWRIAYTPDELNESIKHFTELTSEEKKELEFLGEKIREDYFELATKENVEKFIKI